MDNVVCLGFFGLGTAQVRETTRGECLMYPFGRQSRVPGSRGLVRGAHAVGGLTASTTRLTATVAASPLPRTLPYGQTHGPVLTGRPPHARSVSDPNPSPRGTGVSNEQQARIATPAHGGAVDVPREFRGPEDACVSADAIVLPEVLVHLAPVLRGQGRCPVDQRGWLPKRAYALVLE